MLKERMPSTGKLKREEREFECVSVQSGRCVFVTLPASLCKNKIMYMCVPVVSNWDRHGAPSR